MQYAREREQFGHRIITFQGVGFRLASMRVETQALHELAKYTLWVIAQGVNAQGSDPLPDAIALRSAALRAADVVLAGAHQVHGAMGFTSEVDVSWLSLASQQYRRMPEGEHATVGLLTALAESGGYPAFGTIPHIPLSVSS